MKEKQSIGFIDLYGIIIIKRVCSLSIYIVVEFKMETVRNDIIVSNAETSI